MKSNFKSKHQLWFENLQGVCYKFHPKQEEVIWKVSFKNLFSNTWNEKVKTGSGYVTTNLNIAVSHLHSNIPTIANTFPKKPIQLLYSCFYISQ